MNINIENSDGSTILKIEGRPDTTTVTELEKIINERLFRYFGD